jgi:hypothetical protein
MMAPPLEEAGFDQMTYRSNRRTAPDHSGWAGYAPGCDGPDGRAWMSNRQAGLDCERCEITVHWSNRLFLHLFRLAELLLLGRNKAAFLAAEVARLGFANWLSFLAAHNSNSIRIDVDSNTTIRSECQDIKVWYSSSGK